MRIFEIEMSLKQKLTLASSVILDSMHKNLKPGGSFNLSDINGGNCYNWAALVNQIIKGSELFSVVALGGHAFVKINGKFYDADDIDGVNDWKNLSIFKNDKPEDRMLRHDDVSEFYKRWKINKSFIKSLYKIYKGKENENE